MYYNRAGSSLVSLSPENVYACEMEIITLTCKVIQDGAVQPRARWEISFSDPAISVLTTTFVSSDTVGITLDVVNTRSHHFFFNLQSISPYITTMTTTAIVSLNRSVITCIDAAAVSGMQVSVAEIHVLSNSWLYSVDSILISFRMSN